MSLISSNPWRPRREAVVDEWKRVHGGPSQAHTAGHVQRERDQFGGPGRYNLERGNANDWHRFH